MCENVRMQVVKAKSFKLLTISLRSVKQAMWCTFLLPVDEGKVGGGSSSGNNTKCYTMFNCLSNLVSNCRNTFCCFISLIF